MQIINKLSDCKTNLGCKLTSDAIALGVAHDFVLDLLPAAQTLVDDHLVRSRERLLNLQQLSGHIQSESK